MQELWRNGEEKKEAGAREPGDGAGGDEGEGEGENPWISPLGAPTPTFLQTFKLEPSTSEGTHNPHLCSTTTVRYLCTCVCVYWYRCTCGDRSWIGDIVGTSWPPVDDVSSEWGTILIFQDIVCV